ncbi:MAG TPA: DUF2157 domain-containing protein [Steroidobacteraceae bacterium]
MKGSLRSALARWTSAGLVDAAQAERIRAWEAEHGDDGRKSHLAIVAFAFGGILLVAGVLLFVAANWDRLPPAGRFALALAMIAVFHVGGAYASRTSAALAATLHAVGTGALGAGIYLSGQIFHMAEHWPGALMLWSVGAALAWWLLRQWPQMLWLALLAPAWLWGEWFEAQPPMAGWRGMGPLTLGLFLLACAYLMASTPEAREPWRRTLTALGAIALIPAAAAIAWSDSASSQALHLSQAELSVQGRIMAWSLAIVIPAGVAWVLREREAAWLAGALAWGLALLWVNPRPDSGELLLWILYAIGAVLLVLWGIRDRQRLAVNLGVLAFALSVLGFYFSSLYDKLGRALGLIGIGVVFIGGGWLLERARRRLIGRITKERA